MSRAGRRQVADTREQDLNYCEFLEQALLQEWGGRHQKGLESRLKQARLPWIKTLEQFDFSFQPSIVHKIMRDLAGQETVFRPPAADAALPG